MTTLLTLATLFAVDAQAQEVRALHLSPDAPNVDIYVDNAAQPTVTDLAFTDGTGYVGAPAGNVNFKITATGTPASAAVLDFDLPLMAGEQYSAVAYGELANIEALALVDDSTGLSPNDIRLQVAHTADGIDDVNVFVSGVGAVATGLSYGGTFQADLPADSYTVGLDTDLDFVPDWSFEVPELAGGTFVNVFAAVDEDGPFLLAWLPNGDTVRIDGSEVQLAGIRAVHLSPDAPNVDVYAGQDLVIEDLAFEEVDGYLEVPGGVYRLRVVPTGTQGPAVLDRYFGFQFETDYSIVAYGNVANITDAKVKVGDCPAAQGEYCIQAFHAADGVGPVDVWNVDTATPVVTGLGFGERGAVFAPEGAWTLGLDTDRDGNADFTFDVPDVGDQVNLQVYAVLDAQGNPFLQVLFNDNTVVRIDAN